MTSSDAEDPDPDSEAEGEAEADEQRNKWIDRAVRVITNIPIDFT